MNVLVINAGSSSLKFQLIETAASHVLAKGQIERIGFDNSVLEYRRGDETKTKETSAVTDHKIAIRLVLERLLDPERGVLDDLSQIAAFGHRFVHGGTAFMDSVLADEPTLDKIRTILDIAPLHNPANLLGIEACIEAAPTTPQAIVFDTAFHAHIPPEAYLYALPYEYYEKYGIRRYGFHGTSHYYISRRVAELMDRPVEELKIITCHLGNGASIAAVKNGWTVETSMGFTPQEGLMMGTRAGDVDAAAVLYMMKRKGLSPEDMDDVLNKQSGALGFTGISSDMREIEEADEQGNERATLFLKMYAYRVKKYIGSYAAVLGGVDAIVFTAGVGENGPITREGACSDLEFLGVELDQEKNWGMERGAEADISTDDSNVRVFVLPTNEEIVIAREAERLCSE